MTELRPIVLCGPSGVGKNALLERLMTEFPKAFTFCASHTTRNPRFGEVDGKDYIFVTKEEMLKKIEAGDFLEHGKFSDNYYAISKQAVSDALNSGRICILIFVPVNLCMNLKTDLNPIFIFVKSPSIDELKKRLIGRKTETKESLKERLEIAKVELEFEETNRDAFDHVITNEDFDKTYIELKGILKSQLDLMHLLE